MLSSQSRKHGFTQATHLLSCLCPLPLCFPPQLTPRMDPDSGAFGGRKVRAVRKYSGSCTLKVCRCKIAFKGEEGGERERQLLSNPEFPYHGVQGSEILRPSVLQESGQHLRVTKGPSQYLRHQEFRQLLTHTI